MPVGKYPTNKPEFRNNGTANCPTCGTFFKKNINVQRYCNPKCTPTYKRSYKVQQFDGNRPKALKRDNYTCQDCGMSDKTHREKWNREITVDHIDGKGRYTADNQQNHALDNLKTLCLSCHGKKDVKRRRPMDQWPVESQKASLSNLKPFNPSIDNLLSDL